MGDSDNAFSTAIDGKQCSDSTICEWTMDAKTKDNMYLFHLVGLCYFLRKKERKEEAEIWLDECFNHNLQKYGATTCSYILGGEGHVRMESQIHPTPKISALLKRLQLTGNVQARIRNEHFRAPLTKKSEAPLLVCKIANKC